MIILRPDAEDEARAAILNRVNQMIGDAGGSVTKTDEWGKKRFAFEIDHMNEGYYYVLNFTADPPALDEVTRVLKITDGVVRFMPVRLDEAATALVEPVAEPAEE